MKSFVYLVIIPIVILSACSDLFEYSPYDEGTTVQHKNSDEIFAITSNFLTCDDTITIALLSDIHDNYDDMADAIVSMNKRGDLQCVICCGDITNFGLAREYEWYVKTINQSKYPFITVIGNHDHRSNGYSNYRKVFGQANLSFASTCYKFILFDNTVWENNNTSPQFTWLEKELEDSTHFNIVVTHIPPFSDQMIGIYGDEFNRIVNAHNTILCLHGHDHTFRETCYNGIHSVVSDAIDARQYLVIKLIHHQSLVQHIYF
jgi:3',5'-cyclic-AMP phosphodiesterase